MSIGFTDCLQLSLIFAYRGSIDCFWGDIRGERRTNCGGQAPALHLGVFRVSAAQTVGRVGACRHLISHQYTWRFLLVVGEGLVVLSFCVRDERREQAPPYDLGVFRERGAVQTMGRVGACPHLIRHQYAWRFFCWLWARVWWFYLFVCGTTGGSKPRPAFRRLPHEVAAQTMGRVGACPHLIRHQYAWRFFCWLWARVWWFYLFVCGTTGGSKPRPAFRRIPRKWRCRRWVGWGLAPTL